MKIIFDHSFDSIISIDNLLEAWEEFIKGKRNKCDVQTFSINLMDNIFSLHHDLFYNTYKHGGYQAFKINDPKPRNIHKASVRDRLLHHAIYRKLYPFFEKTFTVDSYSCRKNKGTHKAISKFRNFFYKVSRNNTQTCWVLKCDIKKFFANIDHQILIAILKEYILNKDIIWLLNEVISSFSSARAGIGLPLGNLTSQLLVNIYMNKFDQFVKHKLKIKYYIRYADDFVFLDSKKVCLEQITPQINQFLAEKLHLQIHPNKVSVKTFSSGIDFLGYVSFADHLILRTKTKRRMMKKINFQNTPSYLGLLKHCRGHKLEKLLYFFRTQITSGGEGGFGAIAGSNNNLFIR